MIRARSLHIKSEQAGDVAVLHCAGRIVRGVTPPSQRCGNQSAANARYCAGSVRSRDVGLRRPRNVGLSAGWSRNKGIQLKLVDPSNFAREMFQRTGLTCVLHISSVGDAVDVPCELDGRSENVTKTSTVGAFAFQ